MHDVDAAAFSEAVNIVLFSILEDRVDLEEYFTRKDDEAQNHGYADWDESSRYSDL